MAAADGVSNGQCEHAPENSLSEFVPLSQTIKLHTPEKPVTGALIILCTWFRAPLKHIKRYVAFHRKHFPGSRILLIHSTLAALVQPYGAQEKGMEPAVQVVKDVLAECGYSKVERPSTVLENEKRESDSPKVEVAGDRRPNFLPKILLHIFSTGGANSASALLYQLRQDIHRPIPLVGLVCDSAPARADRKNALSGFMNAMPPNPVLRALGFISAHILWGFLIVDSVVRQKRSEDYYNSTLGDEAMHDSPDGEPRRISYVASKADTVTQWEYVLQHAEEMKAKRWKVEVLLYDDTGHCNHLVKDEGAYAGVVGRVWERAKL